MGFQLPSSLTRLRDRLPGRENARPKSRGLASATAIEIDGAILRVADAARSGGTSRAGSARAIPLEFPADADRTDAAILGAAVARALAKAKIRPGPTVMGVPRASVVLRTLVVPDTGAEGTIASLVQFQVARDLPFRTEEAVIDFQILRRLPAKPAVDGVTAGTATPAADSVDRVEVLVAVTRQESVQFHTQLAEAAGLTLAALGWASQANTACLRASTDATPGAIRAAVLLRPEEVGIEVEEDGFLLFSRGVPIPASTAADPEAWIRTVTIEVVRTLHAFAGSSGRPAPASAYVFGGTGREAAIAEALRARLGFPVECPDLAARLGLDRTEPDAMNGGFSVLGLALGATDPSGLAFDFLNPKRPTPPTDMRRVRILVGIATGVIALVLVYGIRSTLVKRKLAVLAQLQEELTSGEKKRPTYRQMIQQANTLRLWSSEEREWLDHYAHLSAVLPPSEEVYLTSIAFGPNSAIRLGAQARSGEILAKLDRQLRAAGYDVKPLAVTPGADRNGYGFRTTVELTVPAKLKFDLSKLTPPVRPADDASLDAPKKGGAR